VGEPKGEPEVRKTGYTAVDDGELRAAMAAALDDAI